MVTLLPLLLLVVLPVFVPPVSFAWVIPVDTGVGVIVGVVVSVGLGTGVAVGAGVTVTALLSTKVISGVDSFGAETLTA